MDLTTEALRLGMGLARTRAELASANIANVDTPGYRAQRVDFGRVMGILHDATMHPDMDGNRLQTLGALALKSAPSSADPGATAVSLDGEVADLQAASVDYQSMTTVLSHRFSLMQLALAGKG
jgi:flagellar basal-body rod protein FlgB